MGLVAPPFLMVDVLADQVGERMIGAHRFRHGVLSTDGMGLGELGNPAKALGLRVQGLQKYAQNFPGKSISGYFELHPGSIWGHETRRESFQIDVGLFPHPNPALRFQGLAGGESVCHFPGPDPQPLG